MEPITHTVIAWLSIAISYAIGHYYGEKKGEFNGAMSILKWLEEKVGTSQFNAWMIDWAESSED